MHVQARFWLAGLVVAVGCGGERAATRPSDATPPMPVPAIAPELPTPAAPATPAPATSGDAAVPPADAVCRLAWRTRVGPAERPASLAGLEAWAVLVAGQTRWNLVSNRATPERVASTDAPGWVYAARGRDRGGVVAGDDTFALQLDQRSATPALPLSHSSPAAVDGAGGLVALAAPSAEGIVLLVFPEGAPPRRIVVPGRGGTDLQVRVGPSSIGLAWSDGQSLHVAAVDPSSGTVASRASLSIGPGNRFGVSSLTPDGPSWIVAYGEVHVHTGGRAYWVRFVRWAPGGVLTPAGTLPEETNRSWARLSPLGARTLAAWLEGPLLAPAALKLATLDAALAVQGEPLTLSTPGASASEPLLSVHREWAWLTWLEGEVRMAAGLRCTVLPEPVESGLGAPPGCDGPEDCGGRRCVTSGLGGMYGCTDEECCGAAECGNGCRTDADCPACRPTCRRAEGADHGGCAARR